MLDVFDMNDMSQASLFRLALDGVVARSQDPARGNLLERTQMFSRWQDAKQLHGLWAYGLMPSHTDELCQRGATALAEALREADRFLDSAEARNAMSSERRNV